ncbi:hypothetical protein V8G54_022046 [Vigna mungo]|uniref:Uncharacterized protein n=1 Tax=Vigna mungo TaxID=3915 RepID=A0AAQ3NEA6_VIGMU
MESREKAAQVGEERREEKGREKRRRERERREDQSRSRAFYTMRFWIRETGQAIDCLGSCLQGNYLFQEQVPPSSAMFTLAQLPPFSMGVFSEANPTAITLFPNFVFND